MDYQEQIDLLYAERDNIDEKILRLMELDAADRIDLAVGDKVVIKKTDAIAEVIKCYASAANFHGEVSVEIIVECKTRSGKGYTLQRCEVDKLED